MQAPDLAHFSFLLINRTLYAVVLVIIIILLICLFIVWLLTAPVYIEIDTRVPEASVRWMPIGRCTIWYQEEWLLYVQAPFYRHTFRLAAITSKKKKSAEKKAEPAKRKNIPRKLQKGWQVLRSCTVQQWRLSIDTGDYAKNALLYPFTFYPALYGHLLISFTNENYFHIRIRNQLWKMLVAYLRR
jgi:hypothetical protein